MNFKYRACAADGEILEGYVEADDQDTALEILRSRNMIVINLNARKYVPKNSDPLWKRILLSGTVPGKALMIFFRQLAIMVNAGIGISEAVDLIAAQEKNYNFRHTLNNIKKSIDRGMPLSQAMSEYKIFNALLVSLVKAGEEGKLDISLEQAATLLEKQESLRRKIKGAMFYPTFVILFAFGIAAVFFVFLVPKFRKVFEQMRIELPTLTKTLFETGDWIILNWKMILIYLLIIIFILWLLMTSRFTKKFMDKLKLKLPIIKSVILKSSMARTMTTLSVLISAGVPLMQGLEMAEGVAGNFVIQECFSELRTEVSRGVSLGDASKQIRIFPVLVSQMMRIGEHTGSLDNMLERVASWYDQELDNQLKITVSLMEPIMIIIVGAIVAVIALSIFGPITSAISQMV